MAPLASAAAADEGMKTALAAEAESQAGGLPSPPSLPTRVAALLLRVAAVGFLVTSLVVLVTNKVRVDLTLLGVQFRGFTHFDFVRAYRYMLGTIVIGLAYSLLQIAITLIRIARGKQAMNAGLKFDFYGDMVISYLLASGAAAGFGSTYDLKSMYSSSQFFSQGYRSVLLLFLGFVCTALSSFLSSHTRSRTEEAAVPLSLAASAPGTLLLRVVTFVSLFIPPFIVFRSDDAYEISTTAFNMTVDGYWKLTDLGAFWFMLLPVAIGLVYSLLQIAITLCRIRAGSRRMSGKFKLLFDFWGDKIVSYLLLIGAAMAWGIIEDMKARHAGSGGDKFLVHAYASILLVLLGFVCTATLSLVSSCKLPKKH